MSDDIPAPAPWGVPGWTLTHDSARRRWKARAEVGAVRLTVEGETPEKVRAVVVALRGQTLVAP
jgi:hypothetical protein